MNDGAIAAVPRPISGKTTLRGRIELLAPCPVDMNQNNYERSMIFTCAAGQVIARIASEEAAVSADGAPEMRQVAAMVTLGKNVSLNADMTVVAAIEGRVVQRVGMLSVEPALEVPGNVDFATGNIDFHGDVIVHGNVVDLFHLRSAAEVVVQGVVEGATLDVGGDLTVRGGIAAKGIGHVRVGGKLAARYLTNASIECRGEIHVDKEITNCDIRCAGRIDVRHGTIIGGRVAALAGLICHDLGSPAGLKTIIEVGANYHLHEVVVEKTRELEKITTKIHSVREANRRLLSPTGPLNAAQKETATEIYFELQELETAAKALRMAIKAAFEAGKEVPRAEIQVLRHVHAEVVLRFPLLEVHLGGEVKGPVVFVAAVVGGEPKIVQLNPVSKKAQVLEAVAVLDSVGAQTAALYAQHMEGVAGAHAVHAGHTGHAGQIGHGGWGGHAGQAGRDGHSSK